MDLFVTFPENARTLPDHSDDIWFWLVIWFQWASDMQNDLKWLTSAPQRLEWRYYVAAIRTMKSEKFFTFAFPFFWQTKLTDDEAEGNLHNTNNETARRHRAIFMSCLIVFMDFWNCSSRKYFGSSFFFLLLNIRFRIVRNSYTSI